MTRVLPHPQSGRIQVLVVDDDEDIVVLLKEVLTLGGYDVIGVLSGTEAVITSRKSSFGAALVDLKMPDMSGFQVLEALIEVDPFLPVIIITGASEASNAIESIRRGATNFLAKPFTSEQVLECVEEALRNRSFSDVQVGSDLGRLGILLGTGSTVEKLYRRIRSMSATRKNILLVGEYGTRKELVAREIHRLSTRSSKTFATMSCTGKSDIVLQSELFGYVPGAFPGADTSSAGALELANDGTLYIEDINTMPIRTQSAFLGFLQESEVSRLGSHVPISLDVRIISSITLEPGMVASLDDMNYALCYHLSSTVLSFPPLREHPDDISKLAIASIRRLSEQYQKPRRLSPKSIELLLSHSWPRNLDELDEVLEGAFHRSTRPEIFPKDLQPDIGDLDDTQLMSMEQVLRNHVRDVLKKTGGNKKRAAKLLGISLYKLKQCLDEQEQNESGEP